MNRKKLQCFMAGIANEAGDFAISQQGRVSIYSKINGDRQNEIVTSTDREVEHTISKYLFRVAPSIPVIGEEGFDGDFSAFSVQRYFVVDPIDGTAQFAKGDPDWAVSLALIEKQIPTIGILYFPARKQLFEARLGNGVFLNGEKHLVRRESRSSGYIGVSPRQILIPELMSKVESTGLRPKSISSLTPKIGALLTGEVDAAVYFQQEGKSAKVWDYAAASILLNEHRGTISSLEAYPSSLRFSGEEVIHRSGWLAAKDLQLCEKLAQRLQLC